jgi:hypothetical protein
MSEAPPRRSVIRGIYRLARLRPEGFAEFEGTRQGFLNSLAPPLGLMLVACALLAVQYGVLGGLQMMLMFVVALLGPLVVGEAVATRMGRGEHWLRYVTAFNWCQWAIPVVGLLAVLGAGMMAVAGAPEGFVRQVLRVAILGYVLVLYVFLARHGLGLGWGAALAFVVAMHLGGGLLLVVPDLLVQVLS